MGKKRRVDGKGKPKDSSNGKRSRKESKAQFAKHDVYEVEEEEENPNVLEKYEGTDVYEYKFPEAGNYDDEDIDSDEAFDNEDEEKYAEFFNKRGKSKKKKKRLSEAEVNLNEDDEDEDEDDDESVDVDGEDGMDLSELLSGGITEEAVDAKLGDSDSNESEDEDGEDLNADLVSAVTSLDRGKRVRVKERTEAHAESEYSLAAPKTTLSIQDLMGDKDDVTYRQLQEKYLKTKQLQLQKPLGKTEKKAATREVAYGDAKDNMEKWVPTVKANRIAESLSFPLNHTATPLTSTPASLQDKFTPASGMESEISAILESSHAVERSGKAYTKEEELAMAGLSKDEMERRRTELGRMRALMSYYEKKCKRVAKIKSKTFHKLHKKGKKEKMSLEDLNEIDPEAAQDKLFEVEKTRAKERMSLRHKNKSKFIKQMLKRKDVDPNARAAIAQQLQLDQELRKKITLNDEDNESSNESEKDNEEITGESVLRLKEDMNDNAPDQAASGVYALKFMRTAVARKKKEAEMQMEKLAKELRGEKSTEVAELNGRRSFGGPSKTRKIKGKAQAANKQQSSTAMDVGSWDEDEESNGSDDGADNEHAANTRTFSVTMKEAITVGKPSKQKGNSKKSAKTNKTQNQTKSALKAATRPTGGKRKAVEEEEEIDTEAVNPWITAASHDKGLTPDMALSALSSKAEKQIAKLQRTSARKKAAGKASAQNVVLDLSKESSKQENGLRLSDVLPSNDSDKTQRFNILRNASKEQQDLIKEAFAGDNVIAEDFEKEKAALVDQETEKDVDLTLPGWGAWGGKGIAAPKKKIIKKAPVQNPRNDRNLKHVIINEKRDKKIAAKSIPSLPYPYKSHEQLERSIRQPVGKEWNTNATFQTLTKPRVQTKAGTIIEPMRLTKAVIKAGKEGNGKKKKSSRT